MSANDPKNNKQQPGSDTPQGFSLKPLSGPDMGGPAGQAPPPPKGPARTPNASAGRPRRVDHNVNTPIPDAILGDPAVPNDSLELSDGDDNGRRRKIFIGAVCAIIALIAIALMAGGGKDGGNPAPSNTPETPLTAGTTDETEDETTPDRPAKPAGDKKPSSAKKPASNDNPKSSNGKTATKPGSSTSRPGGATSPGAKPSGRPDTPAKSDKPAKKRRKKLPKKSRIGVVRTGTGTGATADDIGKIAINRNKDVATELLTRAEKYLKRNKIPRALADDREAVAKIVGQALGVKTVAKLDLKLEETLIVYSLGQYDGRIFLVYKPKGDKAPKQKTIRIWEPKPIESKSPQSQK